MKTIPAALLLKVSIVLFMILSHGLAQATVNMKNYNIVLIPEKATQKKFIDYAQSNFKVFVEEDLQQDLSTKLPNPIHYILEENSIPHVSICQFQCEESNLASLRDVFSAWSKKQINPKLNLNLFSHIPLSGSFSPKMAAEISLERTLELLQLHREALKFIQNAPFKTKITMSAYDHDSLSHYRPHLTLAMFNFREHTISDFQYLLGKNVEFSLCLGKADHSWQLTEILYCAPV